MSVSPPATRQADVIEEARILPAAALPAWRQRVAASGVPTWLLVLVAVVPFLVLLLDLGTPSLWDPDEGLPAEVAREMLISGDWLSPKLNFVSYREKPPAYFWILAAAFRVFGERNEAAIRLPSVLLALGVIWWIFFWGWRHLRPIVGAFAALVLTTTAGYVAISRLGIDDAASGLLLTISTLAMSEPLLSRRARFPWLAYVALAAAALSLGACAVLLPIFVAAVFVALVREPGRLLDLRPLRGVGIVAILIMPVLLLASARDPVYVSGLFKEYSQIVFFDPHFHEEHSYSLPAFLAITVILMLPWGIFLPWTLRDALRSGGERSPEARIFLLAWLAGDIAFFVVTGANLVTYVILALAPLAALTARALARFLRAPRPQSLLTDPILLGSAILFVIVLAAPFLTRRVLLNEFPIYADKLVFSFLLIPFAAAGIGAVARRNRLGALGAIVACSVVTLMSLYRFGSATVSAYNSMELPAGLIAVRLPPEAPIVSYGTTSHTLAFYSGRPVTLVVNVRDARELLNGERPIALLTKERFLPDVRAVLDRSLYVWWVGDSKKMLLANIPPPPDADRRILLPALPAK